MSLTKIAVLISGGGTNLQAIIDNIHDNYGEIAIVISNKKEAYGLERAKSNNIKTKYLTQKDFDDLSKYNEEMIKVLKENKVELVILAGYLNIVPKAIVDEYPNQIINVHPSLIPSFCGEGYYGLKVHKAVLDYGVKITGVTVHFVDEGADTGPIIMQEPVEVLDDDTPEKLQQRVLGLEHRILSEVIKKYCLGNIFVENRKVIIR